MLLVLGDASVPQLQDHFAKQNPACVHVWHRDNVLYMGRVSQRRGTITNELSPARMM